MYQRKNLPIAREGTNSPFFNFSGVSVQTDKEMKRDVILVDNKSGNFITNSIRWFKNMVLNKIMGLSDQVEDINKKWVTHLIVLLLLLLLCVLIFGLTWYFYYSRNYKMYVMRRDSMEESNIIVTVEHKSIEIPQVSLMYYRTVADYNAKRRKCIRGFKNKWEDETLSWSLIEATLEQVAREENLPFVCASLIKEWSQVPCLCYYQKGHTEYFFYDPHEDKVKDPFAPSGRYATVKETSKIISEIESRKVAIPLSFRIEYTDTKTGQSMKYLAKDAEVLYIMRMVQLSGQDDIDIVFIDE